MPRSIVLQLETDREEPEIASSSAEVIRLLNDAERFGQVFKDAELIVTHPLEMWDTAGRLSDILDLMHNNMVHEGLGVERPVHMMVHREGLYDREATYTVTLLYDGERTLASRHRE